MTEASQNSTCMIISAQPSLERLIWAWVVPLKVELSSFGRCGVWRGAGSCKLLDRRWAWQYALLHSTRGELRPV